MQEGLLGASSVSLHEALFGVHISAWPGAGAPSVGCLCVSVAVPCGIVPRSV